MKTIRLKDGGFTLIELLVVIAVIAALSGVTLTATRSMMKSGRRTKELHAARQFMAAYLTFPYDHDGELMRGYDKTVQKISLAEGRVTAGEMCCNGINYPDFAAPRRIPSLARFSPARSRCNRSRARFRSTRKTWAIW